MIDFLAFIDNDRVQQTMTLFGTVNYFEVAPCFTWILPVTVGQGQCVC